MREMTEEEKVKWKPKQTANTNVVTSTGGYYQYTRPAETGIKIKVEHKVKASDKAEEETKEETGTD
jgi:hypothetical protein